ncbi:MAG: hypothetical protein HGA45_05520 [Chloroflexales bacterium]|nr:hypothetical protein [Chloroflexales bacterium]
MAVLVYALYFLAGLALLVWTTVLWRRSRSLGLALTAAILAGICYDTLLIAAGSLIGAGPLLLALSWARFLLHALQTPLLLVAGVDLARRARLAWARQSSTWLAVWTVTVGLIALGIVTDVVGLELEPRPFQGTLRYAEVVTVPPIATVAVIGLLVLLSGLFWHGTRWPWLFAACILTLASGGVPVALVGPALTSGAEIVLLGCLLAAERRLSYALDKAAEPQSEAGKASSLPQLIVGEAYHPPGER